MDALNDLFPDVQLLSFSGRTVTTVYEEKRYNPRLTKSREEFIQIMNTLNLAHATDNQMGINLQKFSLSN